MCTIPFHQVEWDNEKDCFETFAKETAEFFALKSKWVPPEDDDDVEESFEVITIIVCHVVILQPLAILLLNIFNLLNRKFSVSLAHQQV